MEATRTEPALADPEAREFLRGADPVLARIIDARPDFRPRAWTQDLPALDAFSTLIFQVIGQQLSVRATRTILSRLEQMFGGRMPTPVEMVAADPAAVRSSGMSTRKAATLRALVDGIRKQVNERKYAAACKTFDPAHATKRTRLNWGDGPEWTRGGRSWAERPPAPR